MCSQEKGYHQNSLCHSPPKSGSASVPSPGFSAASCANTPMARTKNGRISLISIELRLGSCEKRVELSEIASRKRPILVPIARCGPTPEDLLYSLLVELPAGPSAPNAAGQHLRCHPMRCESRGQTGAGQPMRLMAYTSKRTLAISLDRKGRSQNSGRPVSSASLSWRYSVKC